MAASLKASKYLVDSTDLAASGVALIHDGAGLWAGLSESIGVATAAGANGGDVSGGVFPPYVHSTMYRIDAAGYDAVDAAFRALRRRCKPGRTITLTKQIPDPEGGASNVNLTTQARRQGDRPEWLTGNSMQVDIDWLIVDGLWIGAEESISAVGAVTVKGDLPTSQVTVTIAAGAVDPVLSNTNGYSLRYVGTVPAGGVEVDVANRRATGLTGPVDLSANLRWSKDDPFQLDPGAQTLAISSGSASFDYLPAYS